MHELINAIADLELPVFHPPRAGCKDDLLLPGALAYGVAAPVLLADREARDIGEGLRQQGVAQLLEPLLGPGDDNSTTRTGWRQYTWMNSLVWLENVVRERPQRWLPKNYKSWDELLTAALDQAERLVVLAEGLSPLEEYRRMTGPKGTIQEYDRVAKAVRQVVVLEFELRGLFKAPDRDRSPRSRHADRSIPGRGDGRASRLRQDRPERSFARAEADPSGAREPAR